MNTLYYGDNLDILRRYVPDETVDLVYLDPPFNSKATYNMLFEEHDGSKSAAQFQAFEDTWHWDQAAAAAYQEVAERGEKISQAIIAMRQMLGDTDMLAYLSMMAIRLIELRRVLKPTGSIYLHCDPTASHYLKIIMDSIFGVENYRNEIIWDYTFRMMDLPKFFNRKHDIILFYAKSKESFFNMPKTEWTKEDLIKSRKQAIHVDENGEEWIWMPGGKGHSKNKLRKISEIIEGGKALSDVWTIPIISSSAKERMGYPTQKPLALLERIIQASSNPGDLVLDPFCGCGTAVVAAQKLGRVWIGIDITHVAITVMKRRLIETFEPDPNFNVIGEPTTVEDAAELAQSDPYQFQWWALGLVGARPIEQKKGADKGIDGRLYFHEKDGGETKQVIFSVKAGGTNASHVRDLHGVIDRDNAAIGVLITMEEPTKPMRAEAASGGSYTSPWGVHPKLQILTVRELLEGKKIDMPPVHQVNVTYKRAPKQQKRKGDQPTLV
ncbi:MAG TPA: DNA methyltransferase [Anaerolineaceae bacterium]|nr:DNA methyltransferase [Anaerolineaceae bacterium]